MIDAFILKFFIQIITFICVHNNVQQIHNSVILSIFALLLHKPAPKK